jgi:CspA family cold shock protein
MAREKGIVKWFSTDKGYGFIRREGGDEIFVHHTDIDVDGYAALKNGETVEFDVFDSDRGPKARNLVPLTEDGSPRSGGRAKGEPRPEKPDREAGGRKAGGGGRSSGDRGSAAAATDVKKPLAEQLRKRLAGRFPGLKN